MLSLPIKKKWFLPILLIFVGCTQTTVRNEQISQLLEEQLLLEHQKGNCDLVFVVNELNCKPCFENVKDLCLSKYGVEVINVLPQFRKPYEFEQNRKFVNQKTLQKLGLLRSLGTVLIYSKGKIVFEESLDTDDYTLLKNNMKNKLRENCLIHEGRKLSLQLIW